jgi:PHP family Zn ribbon phosphoesterase
MNVFKADLHIHTCLSPCAELEMSPKNIVKQAKDCGLDIIGICDHNSGENVLAVQRSAQQAGLSVIYGIEVTSREEVHILALFESERELLRMQNIIYDNLKGINIEEFYGEQVIVNEYDEVVGFNNRLLIGATNLSVDKIVDLIHELNGLAIAAHIDRESFSIIGQLGFIPDSLHFDALEISSKDKLPVNIKPIPLISSSDAHTLNAIGSRFTLFFMKNTSFEEIRKSFLEENERKVMI